MFLLVAYIRHVRKTCKVTHPSHLNRWFRGSGQTGTSGGCPTFFDMNNKQSLRKKIREQRRSLTTRQRDHLSKQMCARVARLTNIFINKRIAIYWPFDGEINPLPLIHKCRNQPVKFYLPNLPHFKWQPMHFCRFTTKSKFENNKFGIPEIICAKKCSITAKELDIVLMPLVGFDSQGNRLGMGGGFYDRTFSYLANRKSLHKPKLIGLAYEFQHIDKLKREPWDIPLTAVITEKSVYNLKRHPHIEHHSL